MKIISLKDNWPSRLSGDGGRRFMKLTILIAYSWLCVVRVADSQGIADINERMMQSTFLVTDEARHGCGTGFVIEKRQTNGIGHVFVTAEHVLASLSGETAVILLRVSTGPDKWVAAPCTNRIRQGTNTLYTKHPTMDVAAFYLAIPENCQKLQMPEDWLLTEEVIRGIKIGPGTELLNLGYPFCQTSQGENFPLLRSGRIASYPILPVAERSSFELAITVFGGNSGGPVYLSNYEEPGAQFTVPLRRHFGVVGMLTTSRVTTFTSQSLDETVIKQINLGFAGVIHAQFIKETIDLLPKYW